MRKAMMRITLLLMIILILVPVGFKCCTKEIHSLDQFGEMLPINLCGSEVTFKDYVVEDYVVETRLVLYYEITDSELQARDYYQYKTDYNPLPSYDKDDIDKDYLKDYLLQFDLNEENLAYGNVIFSQYRETAYEIKLYVFTTPDDASRYQIVLLTDVPARLRVQL